MRVKWDQDEKQQEYYRDIYYGIYSGTYFHPSLMASGPMQHFMLNPFRLFMYSSLHSSHASDSLQD